MARSQPASKPTWTDVKAELASFDQLGLLGLIQDLYAAHKDNQTFLHARFGLSENVLKPYKETLDRWLWPDVLRNQDTSVTKAKQAISSYRKAVGEPAGLAELMVFYCERAAGSAAMSGIRMMGTSMHWFVSSKKLEGQRPAICQRSQWLNSPARSSTRYQPQLRLRRRGPYGLPACGLHERVTAIPSVHEPPPTYTGLPKAHNSRRHRTASNLWTLPT